MVKFDVEESGAERRKWFNLAKYSNDLTPISVIERTFSLSKTSKIGSSTATVIQYPLRLSYAATAHKIQGHTVKKPNSLVADLVTWLQPAMAYVILSRVQSITQLFIIGSIPIEKIRPWPSALEELERMNSIALNRNLDEEKILSTGSLNVLSLRKHLADVKGDFKLNKCDVICLQETWLYEGEDQSSYSLQNFQSHFSSIGRGKGTVTFFKDTFEFIKEIKNEKFQIIQIESVEYSVINVYRSENAGSQFPDEILNLLNFDKSIIICGDFNFCSKNQANHEISLALQNNGLSQLVKEATHREGRSLDHMYVYLKDTSLRPKCEVAGCYFSDHDKVMLYIDKNESSSS